MGPAGGRLIVDPNGLLDPMIALALDAGAAAMRVYEEHFEVSRKADASPVTVADEIAEEIILTGLASAAPGVPVLAEEAAASRGAPELGATFFLVDPLDGTREFIDRTDEFTVNIALVANARPVVGVVFAPALGRLYAASPAAGAFRAFPAADGGVTGREPIRVRARPASGLVAVASRSHRSPQTEDYLKALGVRGFAAAGSSLKFCLLAEGGADVYPRLGRTMEWDTAAGQAILEAAGGRVLTHPDGAPLLYGKKHRGYDNPDFIAWGAAAGG